MSKSAGGNVCWERSNWRDDGQNFDSICPFELIFAISVLIEHAQFLLKQVVDRIKDSGKRNISDQRNFQASEKPTKSLMDIDFLTCIGYRVVLIKPYDLKPRLNNNNRVWNYALNSSCHYRRSEMDLSWLENFQLLQRLLKVEEHREKCSWSNHIFDQGWGEATNKPAHSFTFIDGWCCLHKAKVSAGYLWLDSFLLDRWNLHRSFDDVQRL